MRHGDHRLFERIPRHGIGQRHPEHQRGSRSARECLRWEHPHEKTQVRHRIELPGCACPVKGGAQVVSTQPGPGDARLGGFANGERGHQAVRKIGRVHPSIVSGWPMRGGRSRASWGPSGAVRPWGGNGDSYAQPALASRRSRRPESTSCGDSPESVGARGRCRSRRVAGNGVLRPPDMATRQKGGAGTAGRPAQHAPVSPTQAENSSWMRCTPSRSASSPSAYDRRR